jgi:hypothetical protein
VIGRTKLASILTMGIAIVAILILSAAFHDLELSREGQPPPRAERAGQTVPEIPEPEGIELPAYLFALMLLVCLLLMVGIIIVGIVSPKTRKRTIRYLVVLLCLIAISLSLNSPPEPVEPVAGELTIQAPLENVTAPTGVEQAAPPGFELAANQPSWMIWATALTLALLVAAGLVATFWLIWHLTHPPQSPLEQLAEEAQGALDALRAGADPKDTVMRCYLDMSRVLRKQRGITRNQAMTPREFEKSLGETGLPNVEVRQLTRLFEAVRYGTKVPAGSEERQAIDCLTAIVEACKGAS